MLEFENLQTYLHCLVCSDNYKTFCDILTSNHYTLLPSTEFSCQLVLYLFFSLSATFIIEYLNSCHLPGRVTRPFHCNMGSGRSNNSSKERLKWTKELHDMFEKAVNRIGGPDRATPKGILRAMAVPGMTIFHVKSHLQKYRMSVFTREEDHTRGKSERRSISEMLPNFGVTSGAQLAEALQIQKEAQNRLSAQNEVQKSLMLKIEAQGRFLDGIMEEFKNRSPTTKPIKPYSPMLSLPSLSEESDQSSPKEFESNSDEVDAAEISSKDEFRAHKRIKSQDLVMPKMLNTSTCSPELENLNIFTLNRFDDNVFTDQEIGYPWSVGALQSPLPQAFYYTMSL